MKALDRLLDGLPPNTRYCLMVEPLWALFGGVIFYFGALYMDKLGLSSVEMGIVNSVGQLVSCLFFLLAGPIVNKIGRRRASLVFDVLSWSVSMVIWTFAQNFTWFLIGVIFNSAVRVVMVSWNLLMTEDAPKDKLVKVYAIVSIISSFGGFVTLAAGLLFDMYGVIPVMRWTYGVGAVFMTTMFFLRNALCRETANGKVLMEQNRHISLWSLTVQQLRNLKLAAANGHFLMLGVLFLVSTAVTSFNFFQVLHLADHLGYSKTSLGVIPAVNSLLSIFLIILVIPRIKPSADRNGLLLGFVFCTVSAAAFLFLGSDNLYLVLIIQGLGAAAALFMNTYLSSVFLNSIPESHKAELYGLVQMLAIALSIPSGYIAGLLYAANPLVNFGVSVGLFGLGSLFCLGLLRNHRLWPAS